MPAKIILVTFVLPGIAWGLYQIGWTILGGAVLLFGLALVAVAYKERELPGEEERRRYMEAEDATVPRRALILGGGEVARRLARGLQENGRYRIVGFVSDEGEVETLPEAPLLGGREELARLVRDFAIQDVFVAPLPDWREQLVQEVAGAETPVCLHVVPGCFDALLRATDVQSFADVAALPLVSGAARAGDGVKRVLDAAFAVVSLLVLGLPMLLVGALIRLTSAGGAIYRQERVGRGGRVFIVYKFRTMVDGAESGTGPVLAAGDGDSRLTPLGRFLRNHRIDELPQLINVLKGDMSLVGPRPERPVFVERFCREIPGYALRHRVRPGITGLAQVCGDYHTHPRDKLRFDLIYIGQRSLWLDLVILWRTVRVCLRRGE